MGINLTIAALVLSFHLVRGVPVATFHTNCGPLEMIVDTGASATLFTRRIVETHRRVCFRDLGYCIPASTPVESVNVFFAGIENRKPRIDGVLGRDVLETFHSVTFDYGKKTITFGK